MLPHCIGVFTQIKWAGWLILDRPTVQIIPVLVGHDWCRLGLDFNLAT